MYHNVITQNHSSRSNTEDTDVIKWLVFAAWGGEVVAVGDIN